MAVEFNVKNFNEHYGVGKKYYGKPMSEKELCNFFEKAKKHIVVDEFVPIKKTPNSDVIKEALEKIDVAIKKPTLLTRLKRIPSVLVNILKHIK